MSEIEYIEIEKDGIKTVILATDFDPYAAMGWKPVDKDWTKEREIRDIIDITQVSMEPTK